MSLSNEQQRYGRWLARGLLGLKQQIDDYLDDGGGFDAGALSMLSVVHDAIGRVISTSKGENRIAGGESAPVSPPSLSEQPLTKRRRMQ